MTHWCDIQKRNERPCIGHHWAPISWSGWYSTMKLMKPGFCLSRCFTLKLKQAQCYSETVTRPHLTVFVSGIVLSAKRRFMLHELHEIKCNGHQEKIKNTTYESYEPRKERWAVWRNQIVMWNMPVESSLQSAVPWLCSTRRSFRCTAAATRLMFGRHYGRPRVKKKFEANLSPRKGWKMHWLVAFCFVCAMKNTEIKRPDALFDIYMMMPSGLHDMPGSIFSETGVKISTKCSAPAVLRKIYKGGCRIIDCQCDLEMAFRPLGFDSWTWCLTTVALWILLKAEVTEYLIIMFHLGWH